MNLTIAQTREVDLEVALRSAAVEERHQRDDLPPAPVGWIRSRWSSSKRTWLTACFGRCWALFNELLQRLGARSRPVGDADLVLG